MIDRKENFTGTLKSSGEEYYIHKTRQANPIWTKKEGKLNE